MANIFSAINELDEVTLINLICNVEIINVSNVIGQYGNGVKTKVHKLKNSTASFFGKSKYITEVPEEITVETKTNLLTKQLIKLDKQSLQKRLKNSIKNRLDIDENISEERLSFLLVNSACNYYEDIDENLTQSAKIDAIKRRFAEKIASIIQETANDSKKGMELEKNLDDEINNMTHDQREQLKQQLNLERLNGEAVRELLKKTGGASALVLMPTLAGFGSYAALTTIMHAVFTTALGITLPFAAYTGATSLLSIVAGPIGWISVLGIGGFVLSKNSKKLTYNVMSQVVGLSAYSYGKDFTPKAESMPSWIPEEKRKEHRIDEEKYQNEKKENIELKQKLNRLFDKMEINNYLLEDEKNKKEQLEKEREQLLRKLNDDSEFYDEMLEDLSKDLKKINTELEKKAAVIEKHETTIEEAKCSLEQKNEELTRSNEKLNKKETSKSNELQKNWEGKFERIEFSKKVFKEVIRGFEKVEDKIKIEQALSDLNNAQNPRELDKERGKMYNTGEYHYSFRADSPGRIFYKMLKTSYKGKEKILVTKIIKHNNSTYGK